jgi:hypothetical protein
VLPTETLKTKVFHCKCPHAALRLNPKPSYRYSTCICMPRAPREPPGLLERGLRSWPGAQGQRTVYSNCKIIRNSDDGDPGDTQSKKLKTLFLFLIYLWGAPAPHRPSGIDGLGGLPPPRVPAGGLGGGSPPGSGSQGGGCSPRRHRKLNIFTVGARMPHAGSFPSLLIHIARASACLAGSSRASAIT